MTILQCWCISAEGCFLNHAVLTAGTKMAVTTLVSIVMMKENWLRAAPLPLSPSGPAEISSSGIRILEGETPPGGWRWSGFSWPTEVYLWWTPRPTLTGTTVSLSERRFWLRGSIWRSVKFCLLRSKNMFHTVYFSPSLSTPKRELGFLLPTGNREKV